jgi:hypothetical protein
LLVVTISVIDVDDEMDFFLSAVFIVSNFFYYQFNMVYKSVLVVLVSPNHSCGESNYDSNYQVQY